MKLYSRWCNSDQNVCDFANICKRKNIKFKIVSILKENNNGLYIFYEATREVIY